MRAKTIAAKYRVHVLKHGMIKAQQKWVAFRGGNSDKWVEESDL